MRRERAEGLKRLLERSRVASQFTAMRILILWGRGSSQARTAAYSWRVPWSVRSPAWMRMSPSGIKDEGSSLCVSKTQTIRRVVLGNDGRESIL